MNNRFRARLLVLVIALTAAVAGTGLVISLLLERALRQTVSLEADSGRILRAARELQFAVLQLRGLYIQTLFLSPGSELEAARAEFAGARGTIAERRLALQEAVRGKPGLEDAVRRYSALLEAQWARADAAGELPRTVEVASQVADGLRRAGQEADPQLARIIEEVRAEQDREMRDMDAALGSATHQLVSIFVAVVAVTGLLVFVYLDRAFVRPMSRSIRIAEDVSAGGLHARIPLDRDDEFGIFAAAFNRMLEELTGTHRRLEEANRELESFSYSISHDLRAPLRSINGFAAMLREDAGARLQPEEVALLQRIESAATRMGSMIQDLLELSRIGRGALELAEVDLSRMAAEVVAELRAADAGRAVDVVIEAGVVARCDPGLMRVVLDNLLGNAWKYTQRTDAPRIEFGREGRGADTGFFVRDNGAGFEPALAGRLFRPFQRLHGADEFEGTGIGLATVQQIVARHGGRVSGTAQPGRGAAFQVLLPSSTSLAGG
jgi:signal transduction histidine kinase